MCKNTDNDLDWWDEEAYWNDLRKQARRGRMASPAKILGVVTLLVAVIAAYVLFVA